MKPTSLLGLALTFLLAAQSTIAGAAHSAIEPVPRGDGWWKERQNLLNQRAKDAGKSAQVVFIGDSITQGWEGEGKEAWAKHYKHRNAVNLGIGGDRTQHVLWRLDNGNIDGLEPKVAVVMIGTNNSNGEDNTPGQIADGIAAIVDRLRKKLPNTKVLLLAIFPRNENFSPQRGKLAQINQVIRRLADDQHVHWADLAHLFLNDQGAIPRDIMPDYLHLSPAGYDIWAKAIESMVSRLIGDKPVAGAASGSKSDLAGNWIFKINGPDGKPVESAMVLSVEGTQISGKFQRGPDSDQWLPITDGQIEGDGFRWMVKRDRPSGGDMRYAMSGKLKSGGEIQGKVKTTFNGEEAVSDWSARRKP
ncbi:MAG: hypothetical protein FJ405_04975 [Verrucomicrobia bacterium]|nr:hypothetical protein [Verrucomicrobiota bacterium]